MSWVTVASTSIRGYGTIYLQYDDASTGTSRTSRLRFELSAGASIYATLRDITIDGSNIGSYTLSGSATIWSGSLAAGTRAWSGWVAWYDIGNASYSGSGYIPTGVTNPSTPSVSIASKTYNSATFNVSISSYGVPSDTSGRYIEAAILGQNSYGSSYRYATAKNTTSSTITVNNSSAASPSTFNIEGNHKYWYGGYASNTQASKSVVTGTFYTPCPPLSALTLSSQSYYTYNTVNAVFSYTRQADGGAETRTGYYRYSTNSGSSWSEWISVGTISNTSGTFTATLPTSKTITLEFKLTTPNGGDSETKSVSFTSKTTHTAPNFSNFTYKDSRASTVAITGSDQVFVQGQSQPQVTISKNNRATANDGATITGYTASLVDKSIQIPYSSSASVSGTFENYSPAESGNLVLKVAANDSLNLAKSVSKNVTVIPWSLPVVNASISRLNNFEAESTLKVSGTWSPVVVNNVVKNSIRVYYRYKKSSSSTWETDWTERPVTTSGENFSTVDYVIRFDNRYQWDVEVKAEDSFGNTVVALILSVGIPIFFIGSDGRVSVNGKPSKSLAQGENGLLEVNGRVFSNGKQLLSLDEIYPIGSIYLTTTLDTTTKVHNALGGTWAVWGKGRVPVGVDPNDTDFTPAEKPVVAKSWPDTDIR